MRNRFIIACVAVIVFSISLCTLVGCNTTNKSTDRIEQAINESDNTEDKTVKNDNETVKDDNEQTVINNYNGDYYNNSTINNTTSNYNHSYNTDMNNTDDNNNNDDKTDESNVVKVYVAEGTITNEDGEKEYREYNDYNNSNNNTTTEKNTITPIGDEKYDMDPDPNIVHIKNIKCPSCGAYSYIEHYNKADTNLQFYMGICNSCGYER